MTATTVRIDKKVVPLLKILSQENGRNATEYLTQMVLFIHKSRFDIFEKDFKKLQTLENRIIGFLKQREKDFFMPMNENFVRQETALKQVLFGLESLDIVSFVEKVNKSGADEEKPSLRAPVSSQSRINETSISDESNKLTDVAVENENVLDEDSDTEKLKIDLERALGQNSDLRRELNFLMDNITSGSGLTSNKFIFKGNNSDLKRIRAILRHASL